MQNDETLMLAVKAGDLERFSLLFERHYTRLFAFFYRMTGNASASEDLAQEVFVRILKYRKSFDAGKEFRPWMYQIARNARADHFRRLENEAAPVEDHPADHALSPLQHFEKEQRISMLQRALLTLPEEKRELLVLARYEDMKYEAIAALLQIDVGTVKVRIHRAIRELRAEFLRISGEQTKCDAKTPSAILRNI